MFLLRKPGSLVIHGECLESDEFGWWLDGSNPQLLETSLASDCVSNDSARSITGSLLGQDSATNSLKDKTSGAYIAAERISSASSSPSSSSSSTSSFSSSSSYDPEHQEDEICSAEEPPCQASSRSYTPERLVRTQDYAILTRSPTFSSVSSTPCRRLYSGESQRRLNSLIDQRLVGASQLEALLDPNASEIELPLPASGRKAFRKSFPSGSESPFADADADALLAINSDSPRRARTPDLGSSGSSCERLERAGPAKGGRRESSDSEDLAGQDILPTEPWAPREVHGFAVEEPEDPEFGVRRLRGRIEHLRDINRTIFRDIYSLRRNFQSTEKKTGSLASAASKLRREIRDLRYLDDLVNLLRGKLERISQRNWPFNLAHVDLHSEEINLVI